MTTRTAYHVGNLGSFAPTAADGATVGLDGIVHLPGSSWRDATLEGAVEREYEANPEWADEDWAARCERNADLTLIAEREAAEWT